jgi:hypothetical protein
MGVEGRNHFLIFSDLFKVKDKGCVCHLVWLATTWNIWKLGNNVILNGVTPDASSILDEIKLTSWMWFTSRYGRKACIPYSSWCYDLYSKP